MKNLENQGNYLVFESEILYINKLRVLPSCDQKGWDKSEKKRVDKKSVEIEKNKWC